MTFGESHGTAMGCILDGCPPEIEISEEDIQLELDRRKPGQSDVTTQRQEDDAVQILSGVFEGKTLGTPIGMIIYNKDQQSKDYSNIKDVFRPNHADITYQAKYGHRDYRGGGRASARETANWVAAGAIAKKILKKEGVEVNGFVSAIGKVRAESINYKDIDNKYFFCDESKLSDLDSMFDDLINIGAGMNAAFLSGEENSDEMTKGSGKVKFKSNQAGGILGGISNGDDISLSFIIKPTSSIKTKGKTIDKDGKEVDIEVTGRHDPCVGIRAVPIAEAMVSLVLVDHFLINKAQCADVKQNLPFSE